MEVCIELKTKEGIIVADVDLRVDVSDSREIEAIYIFDGFDADRKSTYKELYEDDPLYPIIKHAVETQKADEIEDEAKNMFSELFSADTRAEYMRDLERE